MNIETIVTVIIVSILAGIGAYFQFSGKKNIAKSIWVGTGIFLVAIGIGSRGGQDEIKQDAQDAIDNSESNDEARTDAVETIDERIESNEGLINEINETLNNN
jgi:hypothetical protein